MHKKVEMVGSKVHKHKSGRDINNRLTHIRSGTFVWIETVMNLLIRLLGAPSIVYHACTFLHS